MEHKISMNFVSPFRFNMVMQTDSSQSMYTDTEKGASIMINDVDGETKLVSFWTQGQQMKGQDR